MRSFRNHLAQALRAIAFVTLASTLPAAAETVEVAPGVQVTKRSFTAPVNEQPFFGFTAKSPEQKAGRRNRGGRKAWTRSRVTCAKCENRHS